jgi:hypothetical protein
MPEPIAGSDRAPFNPATSFETSPACNAELACCNETTLTAETPRPITSPPPYVNSEADSAARELVRRYDASAPAQCGNEKTNAVLSCASAAIAAASTAVSTPSLVGFVLGLGATAGAAARCARDIAAAVHCEERAQTVADVSTDCTARNGVLLTGVDSELICLVVR